jgi:tetratricopeptide (TPR) repeat protein
LQGAAVAVVQYLWDDYNKGKERDAAKQQKLEVASQEFRNKFSTYIACAQNAALDLSQKYSWEKGEAGFDDSQMNRPRDPFLMSQQAYNFSLNNQTPAKDMITAANQCLYAACLVPSGDIYDEYRANALWAAGIIASQAYSKEIGNQSWATAYNQTAASAVQVWKACLKYTQDPTGECREQMAWALMASGNLKEALNQASSIASLRQKSASYAYNLAGLESGLGDTDTAFKWFDYAVRTLDFNNIAQAKTDPDLEAMRTAQKSRFDDLPSVKGECIIGFGIFHDDVILKNNSAFTLTRVVFNGTVTSSGNPQQIPELKVEQIAPGQSYKWVNAISVPNGSTITGTLTSDQNRWGI